MQRLGEITSATVTPDDWATLDRRDGEALMAWMDRLRGTEGPPFVVNATLVGNQLVTDECDPAETSLEADEFVLRQRFYLALTPPPCWPAGASRR